jgi:hypothetical protein
VAGHDRGLAAAGRRADAVERVVHAGQRVDDRVRVVELEVGVEVRRVRRERHRSGLGRHADDLQAGRVAADDAQPDPVGHRLVAPNTKAHPALEDQPHRTARGGTSDTYTVLPLLVLGGVLITIGGAMGPETRDVDMGATAADDIRAEREPRFTREPLGEPSRRPAGAGMTMSREERIT